MVSRFSSHRRQLGESANVAGSSSRDGSPLPLSDIAVLLDMLPDALVVVSEDGLIVAVNDPAERLFSYPRKEMMGQPVEMLVPEASRASHTHQRDRYWSWPAARPMGTSRQLMARRCNGEDFPVEIALSILVSTEGRFVVASIRDESAARRALGELKGLQSEMSGRLVELEKRNRGLFGVNRLTDILQSVETEAEIYKVVAENGPRLFADVSGRLMLRDPPQPHLTQVASWGFVDPAGEETEGTQVALNDCWALRLGRTCGSRYPENSPHCPHVKGLGDYLCIPLIAPGQSIGVLHLRSSSDNCIDAAEEALASTLVDNVALSLSNFRLRKLLESQAQRDPLSGLFNRRYMEHAFERELRYSARHGRPFCFILHDIDHFKGFNDTHGHDAADALLRELARYLQSNIRAEDIACRYGGDELVLILPDTPLEGGTAKAKSLQDGISKLRANHLGQSLPAVTVKMGVSAYPVDGDDLVSLFRAADAELLRAKAVQAGARRSPDGSDA